MVTEKVYSQHVEENLISRQKITTTTFTIITTITILIIILFHVDSVDRFLPIVLSLPPLGNAAAAKRPFQLSIRWKGFYFSLSCLFENTTAAKITSICFSSSSDKLTFRNMFCLPLLEISRLSKTPQSSSSRSIDHQRSPRCVTDCLSSVIRRFDRLSPLVVFLSFTVYHSSECLLCRPQQFSPAAIISKELRSQSSSSPSLSSSPSSSPSS